MNRAERRRAQSERHSKDLDEGIRHLTGSAVSITIVPTNQIFDPTLDPEILKGILELTASIQRDMRPICLTCDYEWTDLRCPPPAAVAAIRSHDLFRDRSKSAVGLFSGICRRCWENKQESLVDECLDRYRKVWPDLCAVGIHPAPGGMQ